jgi:hypothetical protein
MFLIIGFVAGLINIGVTILVWVLASIGEVFVLRVGGAYLLLVGVLGAVIPDNGLRAHLYIKTNTRRILWGPRDWAYEITRRRWENFADAVLGPADGPPAALPPARPRTRGALPRGR